jgi:hypothetical protein
MQELFLSTLTLLQLGRYGHIDIRLIVNPDLLKNNNNKETKRILKNKCVNLFAII